MDMVKKYLFWACTPIGLVVAVLAGWMAIGSIANELNTQKQTLESQKTAMSQLRGGAASHPNQVTIDAINQERESLAANVLTAWEILVLEQQKRNQWTGLADAAVQEIKSKNFLDTLSSLTVSSYQTFAQKEIDKLLDESKISRVQHYGQNGLPLERLQLTNSRSAGGFGGDGGSDSRRMSSAPSPMMGMGPTILRGKVVWDSPQLDFTMRDWEGRRPAPFEVWLTQEDLWVYQALLWVVAESNKDAPERSKMIMPGSAGGRTDSGTGTGAGMDPLNLRDSIVKEIIDLAIGRRAAVELARQSSRRINNFSFGMMESSEGGSSGDSPGGGLGLGFGFEMGGSMSSDSEGMGMMALSGAEAAEAAKKMALAGRYVDADGNPMMEPDFTGQLRRMPVYLNLRVDQRYISDVLVNCANCPMPIDVLWVTVNPDAVQAFNYAPSVGTGMAGASSSYGSSSGGGAGSRRSSSGGGMGRFSGGSGGSAGGVDYGPNQVIVEIYGCINIFAPPEKGKISGETPPS